MGPRWHQRRLWLHRLVALALVSGLLLPAAAPGALAATYDPNLGDGEVAKQTTPGTSREKSFEELRAEDLFSQPIYEVVKADWDKQYKPVSGAGATVTLPAVNYTASGGLEDLRRVENFQGRPGQTL